MQSSGGTKKTKLCLKCHQKGYLYYAATPLNPCTTNNTFCGRNINMPLLKLALFQVLLASVPGSDISDNSER